MSRRTARRIGALVAITSLFLLACVIDEDLRIHSDGSGTYRVRITIPKDLAENFADLRKEVEKEGFDVVQEGETEKERFLVFRKDFDDIAALNDSHTRFELTMTEAGFLRREYHLRASLKSVGLGFKRRLVVSMPGDVSSTTDGEIDGARVKWESSTGGSLDITSSGFYLPLSRGQRTAIGAFIVTALFFLIALRIRRRQPATNIPAAEA